MISPVKSDLLLITYEFPFGGAETFIESELPILCRCFRTVYILPSRVLWAPRAVDLNVVRLLPANALVLGGDTLRRPMGHSLGSLLSLLAVASSGDSAAGSWRNRQKCLFRNCIKASIVAHVLSRFARSHGAIPFVYSYWNDAGVDAAALLRRRLMVPGFIARCHGIDLYLERQAVKMRPLEHYTSSMIDSYVPISQHGLEYLAARGVPREKLFLSRLGVAAALGSSRPSVDGVFRLVTCSGLIPLKRVELLATALEGLDLPFEWTHFGDGPCRAAVTAITEKFSSHGRAVLAGSRPNAQVLAHYRNYPVDLFINISETEGVPVSIMEAFAHGVPCMATRVGGTGEIVDDTCGELLMPDVLPETLRERLRAAATDPGLWLARRAGALSRWSRICNAEDNFTGFAGWLAGVVRNRCNRR